MILCKKCSKNSVIDLMNWEPYYCKIHGTFTRKIFEKEPIIPCSFCAQEKNVCQQCGRDLKASQEEIDKEIERLKNTKNDPSVVFTTAPLWTSGDKK